MASKLLIGVLSYNDAPLLLKAMRPALKIAEKHGAKVVVLDNFGDANLEKKLNELEANIQLLNLGKNLGYAGGYNAILAQNPGHDFYLVLTSDVLLNVDGFEEVFEEMQRDSSLKMAAGKLHRLDMESERPTNIIDSLGIMGGARHHFWDLGAGEKDEGQYDGQLDKVFGISGAVFLMRLNEVEKSGKGILDDGFFMYKEDIDLAYRLHWAGEKIKVLPVIWGHHVRTAANVHGQTTAGLLKGARGKSAFVRRQSYQNHWRLLKKNWTWQFSWRILLATSFYELQKAVFIFFRDPVAFFLGVKMVFSTVEKNSQKVSVKTIQKILVEHQ